MKIIGLDEKGNYIAIVGHSELEKCANKYYGKMNQMKIGQEFDIGAGYDFANDIERACKAMIDATKSFNTSRSTMMEFALMVSKASETNHD